MPRYVSGKGNGKLQRKRKWKGFKNVKHMASWLTRTNHEDKRWIKHFQEPAKNYKKDKPFFHARSLRAVSTKTPVALAGDVLSEMKKHKKGDKIGGGISELLHWLGAEAVQLTGFNSFIEWTGHGYKHKTIPLEAQTFAKAVSATYFKMDKRPDEIENMVRMPEYDTDRLSVWKQTNGQYLITLRGSKAEWGDFRSDLEIAAIGKKQEHSELQDLLDKFDEDGKTYDLAGHSLSTQYIIHSQHQNADKIYLYNSASSPAMSNEYLTTIANDPAYTHFINPSDAVSEAVWQKMTDETVGNSYVAPYTYSPLAAHSISGWYHDLEEPTEKSEEEQPENPSDAFE